MSTSEHPWAQAWEALSPVRRAALHARVVEREPLTALAGRLGRSEADTEALVGSTVRAFRREVVLGLGTGYDEECGSLVLRLTDSAGERLTRGERRALAAHAEACPACAAAVGELLALDAGLRDGLIRLLGAGGYPTELPSVPTPRAGGTVPPAVSAPASRTRGRRRAWVLGAGLAALAVGGLTLSGVLLGDDVADRVTAAYPTSVDSRITDSSLAGPATAVLGGARLSPARGGESVDAAPPAGQDEETSPAAAPPTAVPQQPGPQQPGPQQPGPQQPGPQQPGQPGPGDPDDDPDDPGDGPGAVPLEVAVDPTSGSVTVTVSLLGEPVVLSTPPIRGTRTVNNR